MDHQFNFDQAAPRPSLLEDLDESKTALALIQAAGLLAQAGVRRISARDLAEKINLDSGIALTPSQVGIFLNKMGMPKYLLHGKRRFALDSDQLESIRQTLATQCQERMQQLRDSTEKYQELPDQIQALEDDYQKIQGLRSRELELNQLIAEHQPQTAKVNELEKRWQSLQKEANKVIDLEKEIPVLGQKILELPFLLARKATLEKSLQTYQEEEKVLAAKEAQLAALLNNLKERYAWMDLATLLYNIQLKKQELEELNKQIDDKRSFLDKLLNRHKEGGK
jgi:DNA repair exonuclease SbcCD ATPase subunit